MHFTFSTPCIIIIIIIIIITISFMQGIYTYIPETNKVPKEYNVAAVLSLLFMVPISLAVVLALMYIYISTFRSKCAVPNMAVFCSSLTSWFPDMVTTYFFTYCEIVPVASIITGIFIIIIHSFLTAIGLTPGGNSTVHIYLLILGKRYTTPGVLRAEINRYLKVRGCNVHKYL
jgi:hypothetical protein